MLRDANVMQRLCHAEKDDSLQVTNTEETIPNVNYVNCLDTCSTQGIDVDAFAFSRSAAHSRGNTAHEIFSPMPRTGGSNSVAIRMRICDTARRHGWHSFWHGAASALRSRRKEPE
ncbi:hypothetical protein JJB74_15910 [Noviherbaspirillum sp. DKR-6]|uniref:Uncharacterized protein n=1 Tax=Noviherbaspirillum pedocola TaxID=2801341 RepID=A0A934W7W7_9BURK|nr:hypothetical protein [Noviherbaspirillum pedocola]